MHDLIVTLVVKAGDDPHDMQCAKVKAADALNHWFTEAVHDPPYPPGTLLHWAFVIPSGEPNGGA